MTPAEASAKIAKLEAMVSGGTPAEAENALRLIAKLKTDYVTHKLQGIVKSFGYVAVCVCGWESNGRTTRLSADRVFSEHLREVGQ